MVLPIAMGIGIAAPDLFDALGTVRRTLSFIALSALVLGLYVGAAGYLGVTVGGETCAWRWWWPCSWHWRWNRSAARWSAAPSWSPTARGQP